MNPLIQLKTTPPLLIALALLGFALLPKATPSIQHRTGAIPTSPRQKGKRHFLASLPALRTQQLVGFRSLATQTPASTPLPAQERSFSTPQTKMRRLAQRRFYSTPPDPTTQPLELPPF